MDGLCVWGRGDGVRGDEGFAEYVPGFTYNSFI